MLAAIFSLWPSCCSIPLLWLPQCGLPRLPRYGYAVLPLVKWTSAPTALKDSPKTAVFPFFASPSRPWVRSSSSPGVTRGNHNGGATGLHNVVFPVVSTWNPTWNPLCVPGALGPGGPPTVVKWEMVRLCYVKLEIFFKKTAENNTDDKILIVCNFLLYMW